MEYSSEYLFKEIPNGLVEYKFKNDTLLLIPEIPSWVLVNEFQYRLFKYLHDGKNIDQSIENLCNDFNLSRKNTINEMQVFLSMATNNGFFQAQSENRAFEKELVLYLTEDCNLRCKHCFLSAGSNKDFLPLTKVKKYLLEYSSIKPNGKVLLTGGEPFLHPDLEQIIDIGFNAGLRISINTNGTWIDKEWICKHGKKLHGLQISIDGFTPEVHDSIRGKGSFKKSWKAVSECIRNLPENAIFRISVSVFPKNFKNISDNILQALSSVDPDRRMIVIFNPVAPLGRAESSQSSNYAFINDNLREVFKNLDINGWPIGSDIQPSIKQTKCGIGEYIVVRANGKMTACNFSNDQMEFNSINEGLKHFNQKHKNCTVDFSPICKKCDVRYICFGGCQVVNALEGKGPLNPVCNSDRVNSVISIIVEDERVHRQEIMNEMNLNIKHNDAN